MESDCSKTSDAGQAAAAYDAPAGILTRWAALIGEYEAFRDALRARTQQPYWPGVGPYIAMLRTDAAAAERMLSAGGSDHGDGAVRLVTSTLAAKEAMWRTIKTCQGLVALERRFPKVVKLSSQSGQSTLPEVRVRRRGRYNGAHGSRTDGVFVNAVVDDGREWLRVVTTTPAHLVMELAENGWEWSEGEQGEQGEELDDEKGLDDIAEVSIVEMALDLVEAARVNRQRGAYPRICILLTRIDEHTKGKGGSDMARFLRRFRRGLDELAAGFAPDVDGNRLSVEVHSAKAQRTTAAAPPLDVALQRLMPDMADHLTPTLNIDTSILVALASDIPNSAVPVESWHTAQRVDEITREAKQPGQVLQSLCEVMRGRRLTCTREAARALREMVRDMGQISEKQRTAILVRDGEDHQQTEAERAALIEQYRALSEHSSVIPDDLMLPIAVIDEDWDLARIHSAVTNTAGGKSLPPAAWRVAQDMDASVPTLAVFLYGWASGYTTISTNIAAKNRIALLLERYRTSSHDRGPGVWLCRSARGLNGTKR